MFAESLRVKHIELSGQYELAKHSGGRLEEIANLAGQVQALEWAIEEYEKTCEDEEQEEEFSLEELINDGVGITPFMRGITPEEHTTTRKR